MNKLSTKQKSYLSGFLDGDGSVYVKLTKNKTYRYRYQASGYIVFYQSDVNLNFLQNLQREIGIGYIRKRKDGIVELIVGDEKSQLELIDNISPYSRLKKKQLILMKRILQEKKKVKNGKDFLELCKLIDEFKHLNYSKKRFQNSSEVRKVLLQENLITP